MAYGSPDLTACDYYLRRLLKDNIYQDPRLTINELKKKIRQTIRLINEGTLKLVFKNMKTHLNFAVCEKYRHFEHIMD